MTDPRQIAKRAQTALARSQKPGTLSGLNSAQVAAYLEPYRLAIANSLPNGGNPSRIIQAAVFQITQNQALAGCTAKSIIGCVLNSSLLGMNAALKQCFFIPYGDQATFQLSYTGMIALARRSGMVLDIYANVVRKKDRFEVMQGTNREIIHVPDMADGSEDYRAAYAVIKYSNGGTEFVVMTADQIEKRRLKSKTQRGAPSGVWAEWKEEMWKKTVLRALLKTAPISDEQAAAIATDGESLTPENFQAGEIRPETIEGEFSEIEAEDLSVIRDGVAECGDLDSLEHYWKQGAAEWAKRSDIIEIFNARKTELQ
jgi:recombination protein RecT